MNSYNDDRCPVYHPDISDLLHLDDYILKTLKNLDPTDVPAIKILPPKDWSDDINHFGSDSNISFTLQDYSVSTNKDSSYSLSLQNYSKEVPFLELFKDYDSKNKTTSDINDFWKRLNSKKYTTVKKCGVLSNPSDVHGWSFSSSKKLGKLNPIQDTLVLGSKFSFSSLPNTTGNYHLNYIHKGSPKCWYIVSKDNGELIQSSDEDEDNSFVSPQIMMKKNIEFIEVTQNENEFLLLSPNYKAFQIDTGLNLSELSTLSQDSLQFGNPQQSTSLSLDQDIKNKNLGELLDHSSNELSQIEDNKLINSPLSLSTYNLIQGSSIRSTSPNQSQFFNGNQTTISRISSPLLTRMMDLSNIVEPTLEDPTLKFKKRLTTSQVSSPKLINTAVLNSHDPTLSSTAQELQRTASNTAPNSSHAAHSNMTANNPTLSLLEDNDDNMLALSLASMANSRVSSPRLTLPPLNSALDPSSISMNLNNNSLLSNDNTPNMSSISLNTSNNPNSNLNQNSSILSPKPSYNTNPLSYQSVSSVVNKSIPGAPSSPTTAKLPFIKRLKSPNIVTLNISREGSKSPVSFVSDYRSPLGVTNPLTYTGASNSSLSQLQQLDFNTNNGNINITSSNIIGNTVDTIPSPQPPAQKKPKLEKKSNQNFSSSAPTAGRKKQSSNQPTPSQQTKFASNEIIISENGKVYICQECKRQFSSGHHLTRHKKSVHSGEKPHSCPKCGKRFKRRDHVLQHLNKKIPCTQDGSSSAPVASTTSTIKSETAQPSSSGPDIVAGSGILPSATTSSLQSQPTGPIPTAVSEIPVVHDTEDMTHQEQHYTMVEKI
ncbi:hypothetical protein Kpol_1032p52 [Vanderwaltozyma polyspora DSM 70294]|uniref:C2H2-type domain-containing protein n=1 Tax=Vanderwaltozyma polyspora (strain ATCC 22028 / DSM 70294 / BCRC 21397 / CBS 2163 / NBRC 10782 / NRRL Y-8283 / UCD 57-17) TaxID=436907 RepID=A7TH06_VANPO|nr:uncharacterized protein Kpol_1032p52 [Vanderwaltozyma polyspora DSM 70294]EDO18458.1 hypothetical protein Kpol_1032p52 [Vanderwaltozyma polyspora DSM 70294]